MQNHQLGARNKIAIIELNHFALSANCDCVIEENANNRQYNDNTNNNHRTANCFDRVKMVRPSIVDENQIDYAKNVRGKFCKVVNSYRASFFDALFSALQTMHTPCTSLEWNGMCK